MFRTSRVLSEHDQRLAALALAVAELRAERDKSTPAEIFKLIESLQADIDAIRLSLRSLHGKVAIQKRLEAGNGRAAADIPDDEQFQQMLELQRTFTGGSN